MGLVTWTAVFTLPGLRDSSDEVAQSINGLVGASLQKKLHPQLASRGWNFGDAFAEDHGWHSEAAIFDDGKTIGVSLVTCPELDEAAPDGSALDDRWRIVVGLDLGMFSKTKTRRLQILTRLASDTETACRQMGRPELRLGGRRFSRLIAWLRNTPRPPGRPPPHGAP